MWAQSDFVIQCATEPSQIASQAKTVFRMVWRHDFSSPGFCLIELGPDIDSRVLRRALVTWKEELSATLQNRDRTTFVYRSAGRFDQQETTKFHLDGAPAKSLLMLAYEPSNVQSRLFLSDYCRCAFDLNIAASQFLTEFNPMFRKGEDMLSRYATELPQARSDQSFILLINNSSLSYVNEEQNPLGVMHKAEIVSPNQSEQRIVNSIMLAVGEQDEVGPDQISDFLNTNQLSPKVYA